MPIFYPVDPVRPHLDDAAGSAAVFAAGGCQFGPPPTTAKQLPLPS